MKQFFEFHCNEYHYQISSVYRFEKLFKISGIEIGYGKIHLVKKIEFGTANQFAFYDKNYKNNISFVKSFFDILEKELVKQINNSDIITYFSVSKSRDRMYDRLLKKNGWVNLGSCYFKEQAPLMLHKPIKIFGVSIDISKT